MKSLLLTLSFLIWCFLCFSQTTDIQAPAEGQSQLRLKSNDGSNSIEFRVNNDGKFKLIVNAIDDILTIDDVTKFVGIGTSAPLSELDINGDLSMSDGTGRISFLDGGLEKAFLYFNGSGLHVDNGVANVFVTAADDLFLKSGNLTTLFLSESQKVGLGTTDPQSELDINGDLSMSDGTGRISFLDGGVEEAFFYFNGSILHVDNNVTDVIVSAADDVFLKSGNTNTIMMDENQDVGIGTSNPDARLDIEDNSNSGFPHIMLTETAANDYGRISFQNITSSGSDYWTLAGKAAGVSNNPFFNIFYYDGSTGKNILSIDDAGQNSVFATDIIPSNVGFDLGNNNATEHWDDCVADDFINFSDKRMKKNIHSIDATLHSVMQLSPVRYQYKDSFNKDGRIRTGFLAQDVQKIFPSVVIDEDVDIDKNGDRVIRKSDYLSMNYIELIPILTKAIQEQQGEIEALKKEMINLRELLVAQANQYTMVKN